MATQEYWSAVEEKGLRRNEITCAWFLVLAAVIVLQLITSLAATPDCQAADKTAVAETPSRVVSLRGAGTQVAAPADPQLCGRR